MKEGKQYDVVAVLTGIFAIAYVGGACYGLVSAKLSVQEFLSVVGVPALPLFGYWAKTP